MKKLFNNRYLFSEYTIISFFVIVKILFHLLHPEYGYFRDELYYLSISDLHSFGNLDILPLTPVFLTLFTAIFGESIKALHFASALCGALSLLIACLITRKLGGRKYAIMLTGLFMFFSGFLPFGALFTYDSLDFLIQVYAIYLLVRIMKEDNQKLWILFSLVIGIGLLNKLSILAFGLATFLSLWLVPQRVYFKSKFIWLAGTTALVFLIPFIIWQSKHGWYFLNFLAGYSGSVAYSATFQEFLWSQILPNDVWGFPVWATGLGLLLFSAKWKTFRLLGLIYVILFSLFYFLGAKFYFLIPTYAVLFSVGSIKIEELLNKSDIRKTKVKFIQIAIPIFYVIFSLPLIPMLVPILPIEKFVDYASFFNVNAGVRTEASSYNELPHHVADRFGWTEMVDQVAGIYKEVTSDSKEKTGILTESYGQASAIHVFGKKYDLPEPISLYGWYYFESLRINDFKVQYVTIGLSKDELVDIFEVVTLEGVFTHPYCLPQENNNPIYLCRKPRYHLNEYWKVHQNMDPSFLEVLCEEDVEAAVHYYYDFNKAHPATPLFTESQMNNLGYEYLNSGQIEEAIALFRLNVEVYPESSNVYDSLGEAYMENRQYDLAIINYRKSLELDSDNTNAMEKLKKLEKLKYENCTKR
jgi:hypothetical protein